MNKILALVIVLALSGAVFARPAAADAAGSLNVDGKGTPTASVSSSKAKRQSVTHRASLPKIILGVISGVVVGTPVCAVRSTIDEDKFAITDMTGGNNNSKDNQAAGIFWAPFSAVAGVLQSPFQAVNNSLVHYDQPFSPQQFSLRQRTGSYNKELKNEQNYEPEHRDIEVPTDSSKTFPQPTPGDSTK